VTNKTDISGIDVDVLTAAFKEVAQPIEIAVLPWKRLIKLMKIGEIAGVLSCSKQKDRESYMLFSERISFVRHAVISRNRLNIKKIKTLNDLKNYSVTTISGRETAEQLTKNHIHYRAAKDIRSGLVSILYRDVDILYASEISVQYSAKILGKQNTIKAIYLNDVPKNNLYLCISKSYPNSENILHLFNRGLKIIKENGKYQQIQAKYL